MHSRFATLCIRSSILTAHVRRNVLFVEQHVSVCALTLCGSLHFRYGRLDAQKSFGSVVTRDSCNILVAIIRIAIIWVDSCYLHRERMQRVMHIKYHALCRHRIVIIYGYDIKCFQLFAF